MKTISQNDVIELLRNHRGASPVGFSAITKVDIPKKNNTIGKDIFKLSRVSAFIGFDYEAAVNRQKEREGKEANFIVKPRSWGVKVNDALLEHKGNHYLIAKVERARSPIYLIRDEKTGAFKYISKATIAHMLPEDKKAENQGLNRDIVERTYSISNLHIFNYKKEKYKIK